MAAEGSAHLRGVGREWAARGPTDAGKASGAHAPTTAQWRSVNLRPYTVPMFYRS